MAYNLAMPTLSEALTFDDVLLVPGYTEVLPAEVRVEARLTRDLRLNIPILSAAMDTVSESPLAIALAREGGLGVIHRNLTIARQAEEVDQVKRSKTGTIVEPVALPENAPLRDAESAMARQRVSNQLAYPNAATDARGRLLCAAAVGVGADAIARARELVNAGADAIFIDTAHGHSKGVIDTIPEIKKLGARVIAGNVVTREGVRDLVAAGADGIKVGVGAGSICTTRIVAGAGMPQMTAIMECAEEASHTGTPLIADGGIKYSGDIVKALAAGASTVMLGSLLAGLEECPGDIIVHEGRRFKVYRGMGSLGAMEGLGRDRYGSGQPGRKTVPEGIEGRVPCKGSLCDFVYQLVGGLRSGMGYVGAADLDALRAKARFTRITNAGLIESHPHSVSMAKEAPNYQARDARG